MNDGCLWGSRGLQNEPDGSARRGVRMNDARQMIGLTLLIGQADGKTGAFSLSGRADRMTFLQDGTPTMAMVQPLVIVRGVDGREP